jgi:hypothetical protein
MAHTFEDLKHRTVTDLRAIAQGLPPDTIQGFTQMNKEHLLAAICKALRVDMHAHHEVVGVDKVALKHRIRDLKVRRDALVEAHDATRLHDVRRQIHSLKRQLHKATV